MALSAPDNVYADCIKRTIKNDYLKHRKSEKFIGIKKSSQLYYNKKPHNSIRKIYPVESKNKWFGKSTFPNHLFLDLIMKLMFKNGQRYLGTLTQLHNSYPFTHNPKTIFLISLESVPICFLQPNDE